MRRRFSQGKAFVVDRGSATFGDVIRAQRLRAGLTQQELATRAGVSVRALRYLEQGRIARPRRDAMRRLAEAVGLPADGHWSAWNGGGPDARLRIGVLG